MIENVPELLAGLNTIAALLENVSIPALIALILFVPVATALAMFGMDFLRQRAAREQYAARRQEEAEAEEARRQEAREDRELIRELLEKNREQAAALVEQHRAETAEILRDLSKKHAEVTQFYKDNVELVKTTQRMAGDMRDIILNNTRAVERLSNAVDANFFCPMAREAATGKK